VGVVRVCVRPQDASWAVVRCGVVAVSVSGQPGQWTLTWEDDFSAPTLNTSWWNVADNYTHGNQEWQLYLNDEASGVDVVLRGGGVRLTCTRV
jgi:hypothetical protein